MKTQSRISRLRAPLICGLSALALVTLAGCGPIRLIANTNIPTPLVVKMPNSPAGGTKLRLEPASVVGLSAWYWSSAMTPTCTSVAS